MSNPTRGRKLQIAIDCRIRDSKQGIGTAVLTLTKALCESNVDDQEYTFIVYEHMRDWLAPYVKGPGRLAGIPVVPESPLKVAVHGFVHKIAPLRYLWQKLRGTTGSVPVSDGYVEAHQFDVVHFPTQAAYITKLPSIYQPWDLQHVHYPQFFSQTEFDLRERNYRSFCANASFVCVQAEWTKQDVIKQYGISSDKVVVIPWGSVFDAYQPPSAEAIQAATKKFNLPQEFFFYPAITWPHKNHEVILRALQLLKSQEKRTPLVYFTGAITEYRQTLDKLAQDLGVFEQVHFLGFLSPEELQTVFNKATAMVFASKFEGFGLPLLEAFHAKLPVVSSNSSTLPEVARDGALYFQPDSAEELARQMKTVLDSPEIRQELIRKGTSILSQSSIQNTAARLQALYRTTAAGHSQNHQMPASAATV